jgi:hypothetical protein
MQSALPSAQTPAASRQVWSPIIQECVVHYECRILHKSDVVPGALVQAILDGAYVRAHRRGFNGVVQVETPVRGTRRTYFRLGFTTPRITPAASAALPIFAMVGSSKTASIAISLPSNSVMMRISFVPVISNLVGLGVESAE